MKRWTRVLGLVLAAGVASACGEVDGLDEEEVRPGEEIVEEGGSRPSPEGEGIFSSERETVQRPGGQEFDVEEVELVEEEDDLSDLEFEEAGFDLTCAADLEICRFCGPPVEVATSCSESDSSFPCQVYRLVNKERVDHGLPPLGYDGTLAASAKIHAMDLSLCDFFAHDSLDGTSFFQRCAENGYGGTCTGENIGGGQTSPEAVVAAWMASPGHRENILYPHHTEMGIGYFVGDGGYSRYWVKHLGRR
jgi:hypothetical protein